MTKFAIYGCGVISRVHARAIGSVSGAVLEACADRNPAAAQAFADAQEIRMIPDWDGLIHDDRVDAVCICTPSGTHAELAKEALAAGKHVVLEKPMAITSEQCAQIIQAAQHTSAKLMVISQLRTSKDIIRGRALLESGALGKLLLCQLHMCYYRPASYYEGSWRGTKAMDGGGALMNQGIHGIDILQHLMGPVKALRSAVRTLLHDIEVEDTAVAALEFESGALGVITASTAAYPGFDREIKIYGSKGAMEFREDQLVRLVIEGKEEQICSYASTGMAGSNTILDASGHARQFDAFVRAIHGENVAYLDQYEGKRAVDLIEWIYRKEVQI